MWLCALFCSYSFECLHNIPSDDGPSFTKPTAQILSASLCWKHALGILPSGMTSWVHPQMDGVGGHLADGRSESHPSTGTARRHNGTPALSLPGHPPPRALIPLPLECQLQGPNWSLSGPQPPSLSLEHTGSQRALDRFVE